MNEPITIDHKVLLERLLGTVVRAADLVATDPERVQGEQLGDAFTAGVDVLRGLAGDEAAPVQQLGEYAYQVIHHRHAAVAVGPEVDSVSVLVAIRAGVPECFVFLPHQWQRMVMEAPLMQLGALVGACSKVTDFYNGRFGADLPRVIERRAMSLEAELLRLEAFRVLAGKLNDYQREVVKRYPAGNFKRYGYTRRTVEATS